MARLHIKGTEEYALKLSKLGSSSREVAGEAIYKAADIVANQIKANIQSLPTITDAENIKAYKAGQKSSLTAREKDGLLKSFGVSTMKDDNGYLNVKAGFDGYNTVKTKKYPKGQPNQLIARVVESGSPYMDKMPFIRPALNKSRRPAMQAMQQVIDKKMEEIMK